MKTIFIKFVIFILALTQKQKYIIFILLQNKNEMFQFSISKTHNNRNTSYLKFSGKWWIDLIFFLNFVITIVLNHGQNDER
ncbi:hypothetical protein DWW90_19880 [Parabacteroides sp. AF17-28]|nr:hypothetical protein DWW90_19880 [Parabacteroides sp. AF17-28]